MSNVKACEQLVKQGMIRYSKDMGKGAKNKKQNRPPVLGSDEDFLTAFEQSFPSRDKIKPQKDQENRHRVNCLDSPQSVSDRQAGDETEDFATLLEESFKNRAPQNKRKTTSMPLKKRLKRYPGVEADLDLHGFTAIGAQIKARSFISSCKQQGFFTIRIIVGKGLHSDLGPVLPDVVEDVAKEMKQQDIVLSYQWEKKKKASSGALIVYLKQFEQYD